MKKKIIIKKSIKIIDDKYVIKHKNKSLMDMYNYLLSRSFNYFPAVIKEDDKYIYYEYIDDIVEPREQKIMDLILTVSLLHNKTTIYQEVDIDNYKYLYETISNEINDTYEYYNNLMENIDREFYMSPSNYLIARNIRYIYSSLNYAREHIDLWYKMVENKRKIRLSMVHNNLSLEHYLKSDKSYLISWDKSKIDMPIYDLINLYKNHYLDFDFVEILNLYFSKYPLSNEEMTLFLTIIAIPNKIKMVNSEYLTVLEVRRIVDYVYKTHELLEKYSVKKETNET